MAFIKVVSPAKATGATAEAYKSLARFGGQGMVPKIVGEGAIDYLA